MPDQEIETFKKPAWSFDVKIISNVSEDLQIAGEYAKQLEMGNGNALFPLRSNLYEAYLKMGGEIDGEGNLFDKNALNDLKLYFKELNDWESDNLKVGIEKQQIDPQAFLRLREVLRYIRSILYSEFNRNFMKLVTIYSETEKMDRYSMGRTRPPEVKK
jgi:hypothetical protein